MSELALDYIYRYSFASKTDIDGPTHSIRLATSSLDSQPYFFDSAISRPVIVAETLQCLGLIVRSHFFDRRPGLLDPVVTCGQARLRFEGFSGCCGVYIQCAFDPSAFAGSIDGRGTTNVDFNHQFVQGLAQLRFAQAAALSVGTDRVTLGVEDTCITERKVKMPLRWLRSFGEVQTYLQDAEHRCELPAAEVLRFIRSLPRSAARQSGLVWATTSGNSLRATTRPDAQSIPIAGTERWRALEPILRIARNKIHFWCARDVVTCQVELPGCQFMATFSPDIYRGFSGEGQVLESLSASDWQNALDQVRAQLRWQGNLIPESLATELKLPPAEVRGAMSALATRGVLGFDVAEQSWFHRELPFQADLVESLHPRLLAARKLITQAAVRLHQHVGPDNIEYFVRGTDVEHLVRLSDTADRCTCTWYSKYQNTRGPCKHVLAARMFLDDNPK